MFVVVAFTGEAERAYATTSGVRMQNQATIVRGKTSDIVLIRIEKELSDDRPAFYQPDIPP